METASPYRPEFLAALRLLAVMGKDLIADRMGQFASGSAPEMLGQARALLELHRDADFDYLDRRIRAETGGDHGVEDITND